MNFGTCLWISIFAPKFNLGLMEQKHSSTELNGGGYL
jgi:hypothetical protein